MSSVLGLESLQQLQRRVELDLPSLDLVGDRVDLARQLGNVLEHVVLGAAERAANAALVAARGAVLA